MEVPSEYIERAREDYRRLRIEFQRQMGRGLVPDEAVATAADLQKAQAIKIKADAPPEAKTSGRTREERLDHDEVSVEPWQKIVFSPSRSV